MILAVLFVARRNQLIVESIAHFFTSSERWFQ